MIKVWMNTIKMMILLTITVGIFAWAPTPQRKQRPSGAPFRKSWSCILCDNGETFLPNYAIIENIVKAWLRNNVILIFFNTVCFAAWIVNILLLRILGKSSILSTCSLLLSESNHLWTKQAFPTLTSALENIIQYYNHLLTEHFASSWYWKISYDITTNSWLQLLLFSPWDRSGDIGHVS